VSAPALSVRAWRVDWPLRVPFVIARETQTRVDCIQVSCSDDAGRVGRGEAAGIDYAGETPQSMLDQLLAVQGEIEAGWPHARLHELLPHGGARNALDCALWDLRAKKMGTPVWRLLGLDPPRPVDTAFTLGLMDEAELRAAALAHRDFRLLKVKTNRERGLDPARIVQEVAPHARFILDPNQDWTFADLERWRPLLPAYGVALLEQPLAKAEEDALDGFQRSTPIACDESFNDSDGIAALVGRYDVLNIKLDKAGGLSEAMACVRIGRMHGFSLMVGCMVGSSLAMAPGVLVAQACAFVELDGPLLQAADVTPPIAYQAGQIAPAPAELWG